VQKENTNVNVALSMSAMFGKMIYKNKTLNAKNVISY
jgi:hypothetical protein